MEDVNWLKSFQKLEISDGDTIVVKTPYALTEEMFDKITTEMTALFSNQGYNDNDIKILILEEGMDIGILTKKVPEDI